MTGVTFVLCSLALLPSLGLALDTCDLVCKDDEFLHNNCYGEVCVLLQPGYDRGVMPENQGVDIDEVLQVEAYIRVRGVTDIDMKTGLLTVNFDLQLAWRDPGLSVCNCLGNPVRTEYQMDSSLKSKIWTPRIHYLKSIFMEDNNRRGLFVSDHKDAVEIFQNLQITTTVDCDFSEQLNTYPFGSTTCLIQMEEKDEPLSLFKFNTSLTTTHHNLNKLISDFKITKRGLSEEEQMNVPDFSRTGEYHSCTGFALELTLETDASVAYLFIYFGLSWMAALSVNLRTDKLSPLAITIVSGLAVYLDATKIYPQPIHGLSYLNRFCIASCLVLLLPFVGLIISSKKRWQAQPQFVPEEEGRRLEEEADKVEMITTAVVPLISATLIVIFYVASSAIA